MNRFASLTDKYSNTKNQNVNQNIIYNLIIFTNLYLKNKNA